MGRLLSTSTCKTAIKRLTELLAELPRSLYASSGQFATCNDLQSLKGHTSECLGMIPVSYSSPWSMACPLSVHNAFQAFQPRISHPNKEVRNAGTGTLQHCGSSPLLRFGTKHRLRFSTPTTYLNNRAMERNRSIVGVGRLYSCRTMPRRTALSVLNNNTCTETSEGEKVRGSRISKPLSSQRRGLSNTSQRTLPWLQPNNKPTPTKFWSHRMYKNKDGKDITVHYCKSLETTEKVAQLFLDDKVLGFDMEWKAQASAYDSIQNNVSLIQLANRERIALFQISQFVPGKTQKDFVSPTLQRILETSDTTKVGVSIKADCTRLRKYLGIDTRGIFELSHLYKLVKYCHTPKFINKRPVNLNEQVEEHLGLPLEKEENVRCSNWAVPLSYRQAHYAAADAYACIQLFHTMDAKREALVPIPPLPAHAELNLPIRTVPETEVTVNSAPMGIENIEPVDNSVAVEPKECIHSVI
ncbi:ribonuclease H-like domain-containing protein [Aspergillus californicus]